MSDGRADGSNPTGDRPTSDDWPTFRIRCTFDPDESARAEPLDADEVFLFDPGSDGDARWLSAERGSYVPVEDVR